MKFGSKILGLLLMATLVAAPLATRALAEPDHASALLAAPAEHPAACHTHGGNSVPHSPLPANYKCCLTGHDAAAVRAPHSQPPAAQRTGIAIQVEPALTVGFLGALEVSRALATDPPGTTPLRI